VVNALFFGRTEVTDQRSKGQGIRIQESGIRIQAREIRKRKTRKKWADFELRASVLDVKILIIGNVVMAKGNRHYLPGHVRHITHRCHKREFLLKFALGATPVVRMALLKHLNLPQGKTEDCLSDKRRGRLHLF